jgi:hypothetical protein
MAWNLVSRIEWNSRCQETNILQLLDAREFNFDIYFTMLYSVNLYDALWVWRNLEGTVVAQWK